MLLQCRVVEVGAEGPSDIGADDVVGIGREVDRSVVLVEQKDATNSKECNQRSKVQRKAEVDRDERKVISLAIAYKTIRR